MKEGASYDRVDARSTSLEDFSNCCDLVHNQVGFLNSVLLIILKGCQLVFKPRLCGYHDSLLPNWQMDVAFLNERGRLRERERDCQTCA